jgi:hypothetical protein
MFTAKKFAAVCIRLFASGVALYLVLLLISAALIIHRLPVDLCEALIVGGLGAFLLFIYAIPVAGFIASGIDQS